MSLAQLNLVDAEVVVAGEVVDLSTLYLHQTMSGHHKFKIKVNYRPEKPTVWTVTPEKIFEQLGETIQIKFTHKESGEESIFNGVITNINVEGSNGDQGYVVLEGGSPTLLLDMDPSMGGYMEYTLSNIVSEVLEDSGLGLELSNQAQFTSIIPYAARYKETSYAFLSRMSSSCGDWFYYDGSKMVLGNPNIENDTRAAFDMELTNITISAGMGNLNMELYDYDAVANDYKEDAPIKNIDGINSYMRVARDKSEPFFPNVMKVSTSRGMVDENDIVAQMRAVYSRKFSKMSTFSAESNSCAIRLGELVTTRLPETLQQDVGPDLGRYRVLEITHEINAAGNYKNKFKGVAGMTESVPTDHVVQPVAFPELATVVENADPEALGRVKVRFLWMGDDVTTNWVRVQTSNIGTDENNEGMHGLYFIPSLNDQVMVSFEHGDPSRPFVSGSLTHADNASGVQADHTISKIMTASGHTIELNDTEGEETIKIYDNEGSVIVFDTPNKSLFIQSTENLNINAKNITISAEENVIIEAKGNIDVAAEGDLNNQAQGNVNFQSEGDTTVNSSGAATLAASTDATVAGMNVTVSGDQNVEVSGGVQTNISGTMTAVQGASGKVEVM